MGLGSWVVFQKIPIKGPKFRKSRWELGWLMISISKTGRRTRNIFFIVLRIIIFVSISLWGFSGGLYWWRYSTFRVHFFPLLKTWGKCISVAHSVNQWSIYLWIILQCDVYGGLKKSMVLTAILEEYFFRVGLGFWDMASSVAYLSEATKDLRSRWRLSWCLWYHFFCSC